MNEDLAIALIAGGAPTLAIIVQIILSSIRDKIIAQKVQEVHLIVNNQRTEMSEKIDSQGEEIRQLRDIIEGLQNR